MNIFLIRKAVLGIARVLVVHYSVAAAKWFSCTRCPLEGAVYFPFHTDVQYTLPMTLHIEGNTSLT